MFAHQAALGNVRVAFTDRNGGVSTGDYRSLNLGRTDHDQVAAVAENFQRVRRSLGLSQIVTVAQQHTAEVEVIDEGRLVGWDPQAHLGTAAGQPPLSVVDGIVTSLAEVALCIRVADCLPILLADQHAGTIAAVHAGRQGLADGIVVEAVRSMRAQGADRLTAWIGPHICGRCYEVPDDLQAEVAALVPGSAVTTQWGTAGLDLAAGAVGQLERLGCSIAYLGACTRTSPELFSHRGDGPGAGRLAGFIWRTG